MVRVGVWNRVSVSKTVALLSFVTLRPAKWSVVSCYRYKRPVYNFVKHRNKAQTHAETRHYVATAK